MGARRFSADVSAIFEEMRAIQQLFLQQHGVDDIWSNSKVFEVLIANTLDHAMIPGHSGSLDAVDDDGNEYEYKHFKETSSNHSWTFNDYSDMTIAKLRERTHAVVFCHVDDTGNPPALDWAYTLPGRVVGDYLATHTVGMRNARRMINISALQIEARTGHQKQHYDRSLSEGRYGAELQRILTLIGQLERRVGVQNVLTSNKFWEVLVSLPLGHTVNSEQGGRAGAHDAMCAEGKDYEYKVSKSRSWNFQDISDAVLQKYTGCEAIVLAIVDKTAIDIREIWFADPERVIARLRQKLGERRAKLAAEGKELRRLQVSLSAGDVAKVEARRVL